MLLYWFCFMFWFFGGHKPCGILIPQPGVRPTPPALGGKAFTTGPPGKSLPSSFDLGIVVTRISQLGVSSHPPRPISSSTYMNTLESPLPLLQATQSCPFPEFLISSLIVPCYGRCWSRKQQPTPVFLPGKSYGQRSLMGYSP